MPNAILGSPAGGLEEPDLATHRTNTTMSYQADRPFTLYFVRHGITEPNFRGFRCGGDSDPPIKDIGCAQGNPLAPPTHPTHLLLGLSPPGSLTPPPQTPPIPTRRP